MSLAYPPDSARARTPLRPELALGTPVWLAALAILIVNDHLLKGAEMLPAPITGKLSDLAGMIVAPALLAALLRVRARGSLVACHVAVGVVFAAINLSPAAAALWSGLMGAVAIPWAITVDPTDLVALPLLALSYALMLPVMERRPSAPPRRLAESGAASIGLLACVATSPPPEDWEGTDTDWIGDESYTPITADVYINNPSETEDLVIRVRELSDAAVGNCSVLAQDPGQLVTPPLLGPTTTWTLPPGTNAAVRDVSRSADCHAVLVEIDGLPPALLFWLNGTIRQTEVEGLITDPAQHTEGAVVIDRDAIGLAAYQANSPEIVFAVATEPSELSQSPTCEPLSEGARLDWTKAPSGIKRITHVDLSLDGCAGLHLDDGVGEPPPEAADTPVDWYVCLPPALEFPFVAGDRVSVSEINGFGGSPRLNVELVIDPENPAHTHSVELVLGTGGEPPFVSGTVMDFQAVDACGPVVEPSCGTIVERGELAVRFLAAEMYTLAAGTGITMGDDAESVELHLAYAERRLFYNGACANPPYELGPDLEIAAVHRAAL
ncbi:MAG: hypothetical protein H6713_24570 [Myxococcales bacterium]|nr:hypothetical protein [Myxococcales bacterium]